MRLLCPHGRPFRYWQVELPASGCCSSVDRRMASVSRLIYIGGHLCTYSTHESVFHVRASCDFVVGHMQALQILKAEIHWRSSHLQGGRGFAMGDLNSQSEASQDSLAKLAIDERKSFMSGQKSKRHTHQRKCLILCCCCLLQASYMGFS